MDDRSSNLHQYMYGRDLGHRLGLVDVGAIHGVKMAFPLSELQLSIQLAGLTHASRNRVLTQNIWTAEGYVVDRMPLGRNTSTAERVVCHLKLVSQWSEELTLYRKLVA